MILFNLSILLLVMCHLDSRSARTLFLPGMWENWNCILFTAVISQRFLAQVAKVISLALPVFRT